MFLTRMELNRARRKTPELLENRHRLHAAVMAGFGSERGDGRVLWRIDPGQHDPVLYLVSPTPPDLTHLVEQVGRPTTQGWRTAPYERMLDNLTRGQQWAFRLHANPVHSPRLPAGAAGGRGKVLGHVTVEHQRDWLVKRAERLGVRWLEVPGIGKDGESGMEPSVTVTERGVARFRRGQGMVTLTVATYTGMLEVAEPDALRAALTNGIGRAKGYGCGLMTLARPR